MIDDWLMGVELLQTIKGVNNLTLSEKANVHPSYITRMKRPSENYNPNLMTLTKVSNALDMTIEQVIEFKKAVYLMAEGNASG